MTNSFGGHGSECHEYGIVLPVKAFQISTDEETSQLPYMWSIDGEAFDGISTLQAEVCGRGFPLITLPKAPRDSRTHAPIFS